MYRSLPALLLVLPTSFGSIPLNPARLIYVDWYRLYHLRSSVQINRKLNLCFVCIASVPCYVPDCLSVHLYVRPSCQRLEAQLKCIFHPLFDIIIVAFPILLHLATAVAAACVYTIRPSSVVVGVGLLLQQVAHRERWASG